MFNRLNNISRQNILTIGNSLAEVPEVTEAYRKALEMPFLTLKIFYSYIHLIQDLSAITEEDLEIIRVAHNIMQKKTGKEPKLQLIHFLANLTLDQRSALNLLILNAVNPESIFYAQALTNLTDMMERGHRMSIEGRRPVDGDPESDGLIWGHTQLTDPKVLIEFTICHYIERYMSAAFQREGLELANHKDWFLNCLTDVITLKAAKKDYLDRIARSWIVPRVDGGLGWLKPARIGYFKEAIRIHKLVEG